MSDAIETTADAAIATARQYDDAEREAMRKAASEAVRMLALWKLLGAFGGTMTLKRADFEETENRRMKVSYTVETDEYTLTLIK